MYDTNIESYYSFKMIFKYLKKKTEKYNNYLFG